MAKPSSRMRFLDLFDTGTIQARPEYPTLVPDYARARTSRKPRRKRLVTASKVRWHHDG